MKALLSLVLAFCICGKGFAQKTSPEPPDTGTFAKAFQPYVDDQTIAGAVFLVATQDKVLDKEEIGYADLASRRPMAANQEFWVASMTKPFTAVALMMLVDAGKVSVDDPVEKYLPEFKALKVKTPEGTVALSHPILVRELLSHTSGMGNIRDDSNQPLAQRVSAFVNEPLEVQPGIRFKYVNAGISTIGRVIEVVSGMPYEQFIQERILTPLKMTDTTFTPNPEQASRIATAYQVNDSGDGLKIAPNPVFPSSYTQKVYAFPAGGLFSTAPDLLKFCRMLLAGGTYEGRTYISKTSLDIMVKRYTTPETGGSYGLGWMLVPNAFLHDGAFKTRMSINPSKGLIEIFMVQLATPLPKRGNEIQRVFTHTADDTFGGSATPVIPPHDAAVTLFDGKDLSSFNAFLKDHGLNSDPNKVFAVESGTIHVSGTEMGYIVTRQSFENFYLRASFKWGEKTYGVREGKARDSGILYSVQGEPKVWPYSIEFQVQEGCTGDIWLTDGASLTDRQGVRQEAPAGKGIKIDRIDKSSFTDSIGFRPANDLEKPHGEWNLLELVVQDGTVHQYVNGKLANTATDISPQQGLILFQSEGAEVFYKDISVSQLKH